MNLEEMESYPPTMAPPPETGVETAAHAAPETAGILKTLAACLAAAIVPGLGHAVLGKWDRALVFMGSIGLMFAFGLQYHGRLFNPDFSDLFSSLKFIADAGNGLPYWLCWLRGLGTGDAAAYTYDFANVFIYTAGLLNMLVVIDAFDVAQGRKP
jgi:hypothetical protein